jgi:hypothetical protein
MLCGGCKVKFHSGVGTNTAIDLFWGRAKPRRPPFGHVYSC